MSTRSGRPGCHFWTSKVPGQDVLCTRRGHHEHRVGTSWTPRLRGGHRVVCTVKCGEGLRRRSVQCNHSNGSRCLFHKCGVLNKLRCLAPKGWEERTLDLQFVNGRVVTGTDRDQRCNYTNPTTDFLLRPTGETSSTQQRGPWVTSNLPIIDTEVETSCITPNVW